MAVAVRQGAGYHGRRRRVLGRALLARGGRAADAGAAARRSARSRSTPGRTAAPRRCSSSTSTRPSSSSRSTSRRVRTSTRQARSPRGRTRPRRRSSRRSARPKAAGCSDDTSAPRAAAGCIARSTPPEEVPEDLQRFEQLEGRLEIERPARTRRVGHAEAVLADAARARRHAAHAGELGLAVREESGDAARCCPTAARGFLERLRIEARADGHQRAASAREDRLLDALRALHEERATDDPLNGAAC